LSIYMGCVRIRCGGEKQWREQGSFAAKGAAQDDNKFRTYVE